jgi:hypothetical protein
MPPHLDGTRPEPCDSAPDVAQHLPDLAGRLPDCAGHPPDQIEQPPELLNADRDFAEHVPEHVERAPVCIEHARKGPFGCGGEGAPVGKHIWTLPPRVCTARKGCRRWRRDVVFAGVIFMDIRLGLLITSKKESI